MLLNFLIHFFYVTKLRYIINFNISPFNNFKLIYQTRCREGHTCIFFTFYQNLFYFHTTITAPKNSYKAYTEFYVNVLSCRYRRNIK